MTETKKKTGKDNFQLEKILTISISHHIHDIYTSFLAPILPLLIEKLSISYTLAGFLSVIQRIPSLFNFLIGIFAEKFQMRYFIILSPGITATAMSLLGIAPGYTILAILLLVSGISSTLFHVPTPVMVKHLSGKRVGKGMSYYMVGGEGARTLGPIIILAAVSFWGLEGIYKLIPLGWITSVILFFKLKDVKISTAVHKKYDVEEGYWKIFRKFLPVFVSIAGITLCLGGIKAALTLYLPTFLTDEKGSGLWLAGSSLAILQLSGAAGALFGGSLSDKFGRRNILSLAAIVSPLLMLGFVFASELLLFPLLALTGFFLFIPTPVMLAVIHEQDTKHLAFMNGIFMTLNFFFNASMVLLVGFFSDKIGMEKTFLIAPFFAFGAIIFARMVPKKVKKS